MVWLQIHWRLRNYFHRSQKQEEGRGEGPGGIFSSWYNLINNPILSHVLKYYHYNILA